MKSTLNGFPLSICFLEKVYKFLLGEGATP